MTETTDVPVPEFITFLFSGKPKFDVHFIVGNSNVGKPERIGGVKLMLMAHSEVLRCELEDSEIAEKSDVKVEDIHPETFKSMLKYVYGHDITADLSFDDADNMLYAAEKYMMKRLKDKLATRLMCLLTPDNICSLLNNPACYTHLELDSSMTKILQYETDKVLQCPQFLSLNPDGFLKIVQQEGLAVPEIEVWRAAVKWAMHRAGAEDGTVLRKEMSAVEKHIRVCTLDAYDFCTDVVPTNILSTEEVTLVSHSIGKEEKQDSLTTFCNEIDLRKRLVNTEDVYEYIRFANEKNPSQCENPTFCFDLITKHYPIKLEGLMCTAKHRKRTEPLGWTYKVDCTVTIRKVANPNEGASEANQDNSSMVVRLDKFVRLGERFYNRLIINGNPVTLPPKSKYSIKVAFTGSIQEYPVDPENTIVEEDGLVLELKGSRSPVTKVWYYVVKPKKS